MDEFNESGDPTVDTLAEEILWPTDEMKRLAAQMDSLDASADDVMLES